MRTLSSRIADEVDYFSEPDIEVYAPRAYCDECKRRTVYSYDRWGYRECAEHSDEATEALEI